MATMPKDRTLDSTAAMLVEGYEFISNRCRRLGSDVFQTRLMLQPAICMRGREAAEIFYDTDRFVRAGAAPRRLRKTLFGDGGVQGLDGDAHHHRKAMFLALMSDERMDDLVARVEARWRSRLSRWQQADEVNLYDEVSLLLTAAVHDWAGVPLSGSAVPCRRDQLHGMIEGGGGLGPNFLRGRLDRKRAEGELEDVVTRVRTGELHPPEDTALHVVAWHRTPDGELLDLHTAAVALLNVLRPVVAVDRYITFVAMALHRHPEWRTRLAGAGPDDEHVHAFVQEVRRHYPFFPFTAARVARTFEWKGVTFPEGRRVLLDLHATNHDPHVWPSPSTFDPMRFLGRDVDAYDLVPQGGGTHDTGHRCPGEWITIRLMALATRLLVDGMDYEVPDQDLRLQRGKIPALPTSGFVIRRVAARPAGSAAR